MEHCENCLCEFQHCIQDEYRSLNPSKLNSGLLVLVLSLVLYSTALDFTQTVSNVDIAIIWNIVLNLVLQYTVKIKKLDHM